MEDESLLGKARTKSCAGQLSLLVLVFQFTSFTLLRTHADARHEINSVIMFHAECLKLAISVWFSFRNRSDYLLNLHASLVPLFCFCAMNMLSLWCLKYLNATTFMAIMQMKIIWTALFARLMLKRRLSILKLCLLLLIFNGILSVGLQKTSGDDTSSTNLAIAGLFAETVLSGFSVNYLQYSFGNNLDCLWVRNVQLAALSIVVYSSIVLYGGHSLLHISSIGVGLSALSALGGIAVAFALLYAGSVEKTLATATSMALTSLLESAWLQNTDSLVFKLDCTSVLLSSVVFSLLPHVGRD